MHIFCRSILDIIFDNKITFYDDHSFSVILFCTSIVDIHLLVYVHICMFRRSIMDINLENTKIWKIAKHTMSYYCKRHKEIRVICTMYILQFLCLFLNRVMIFFKELKMLDLWKTMLFSDLYGWPWRNSFESLRKYNVCCKATLS